MMDALAFLRVLLEKNRLGFGGGVVSVCSSHPLVVRAALQVARANGTIALIESTSNQVDQYGGYTGMRPVDFVAFVHRLAALEDFPLERLLLGGDHLGPNPWRRSPASIAMGEAVRLVEAYVQAGYSKIHLDPSMACADDGVSDELDTEIVAERTVLLCGAAERAAVACGGQPPVYVVGTEVPTPGGVVGSDDVLVPTEASRAVLELNVLKDRFKSAGLSSAWGRVIGMVVQPGVEFGDDSVHDYKRVAAVELSKLIESQEGLVYEAHSTDYQLPEALRFMVQDHFAILKVGPWLTFALRQALFALELIEVELAPLRGYECSGLRAAMDRAMVEDPRHWEAYYKGKEAEKAFARVFSLSDRSRYYWTVPEVARATGQLFSNLRVSPIPMALIDQYLPGDWERVRTGEVDADPEELAMERIAGVLRVYGRACVPVDVEG